MPLGVDLGEEPASRSFALAEPVAGGATVRGPWAAAPKERSLRPVDIGAPSFGASTVARRCPQLTPNVEPQLVNLIAGRHTGVRSGLVCSLRAKLPRRRSVDGGPCPPATSVVASPVKQPDTAEAQARLTGKPDDDIADWQATATITNPRHRSPSSRVTTTRADGNKFLVRADPSPGTHQTGKSTLGPAPIGRRWSPVGRSLLTELP